MTAPYSPEVRKRLEALAARCERIAAEHASPFKDGDVFDSETLAAIQWYKQEAADLRAQAAHIETLERALKEIASGHISVPGEAYGHFYHRDCPACHRKEIAAPRALNGASHDQG